MLCSHQTGASRCPYSSEGFALGIGVELAVLTILMGGLAIYHRWYPLLPEMSRKLFHVIGGLTTLTFPWLFMSPWPVVLLAVIVIPSLLALKYAHVFKGNLGSVLYRVDRKSFGEMYFPLSVCLVFVFAYGHALLFIIPILMLTLADPVAAVIGSRYGRLHYMIIKGQKSLEGSAAFFLVALPCVLIPLLLFTAMGRIEAVLIAAIVGLLVMMVEAVTWEGLDNLFIPIVGFLLLKTLQHLDGQTLFFLLLVTFCLLVPAFWQCWQAVANGKLNKQGRQC
jgi:phytol kinase